MFRLTIQNENIMYTVQMLKCLSLHLRSIFRHDLMCISNYRILISKKRVNYRSVSDGLLILINKGLSYITHIEQMYNNLLVLTGRLSYGNKIDVFVRAQKKKKTTILSECKE